MSSVIALYHKQYFQIEENECSFVIFVSWPGVQKYQMLKLTVENLQFWVSGAGFL